MVVERGEAANRDLLRSKTDDMFVLLGRNDIVLYSVSETRNSNGRVLTRTETSSTIVGDLQFVSWKDRELINAGIAQVGDGLFYTTYDVVANNNNVILVDSVRWELVRKVEAEIIEGGMTYQAWVCKRLPDNS